MIVGRGLIASHCSAFEKDDKTIIFASGVSNSQETRKSEYDRERQLLYQTLENHPDKKLIYFSTTSVFDPSKTESAYVQFKRDLEKSLETEDQVIVVRLPILVGPGGNPKQFCQFIYQRLLDGQQFTLNTLANRSLFWVGDLENALGEILRVGGVKSINVCHDNSRRVREIVDIFEHKMNQKANYVEVDQGARYEVDTSEFQRIKELGNHSYLEGAEHIIEAFLRTNK